VKKKRKLASVGCGSRFTVSHFRFEGAMIWDSGFRTSGVEHRDDDVERCLEFGVSGLGLRVEGSALRV
jgi:hypothetical protein